jgi:beta-phosphoglucomutase-like phosphatase (HAD superfamily)
VVAGDDVTFGKPHPQPYQKAAELLGLQAHECIAIEDSVTGLKSAEAAGCLPLGIVNLMPLEATGTRVIRNSLTEMNLEALRGLK